MAKQNFPGVSRRISTKYLYPRFDFPLQINQNHNMTFFRLRDEFNKDFRGNSSTGKTYLITIMISCNSEAENTSGLV